MNRKISSIIARMKTRGHADDITVQMTDMAELLSLISEEQAQATDKMERQTKQLIWLTWALCILSAFTLAFTFYLCQRAV